MLVDLADVRNALNVVDSYVVTPLSKYTYIDNKREIT